MTPRRPSATNLHAHAESPNLSGDEAAQFAANPAVRLNKRMPFAHAPSTPMFFTHSQSSEGNSPEIDIHAARRSISVQKEHHLAPSSGLALAAESDGEPSQSEGYFDGVDADDEDDDEIKAKSNALLNMNNRLLYPPGKHPLLRSNAAVAYSAHGSDDGWGTKPSDYLLTNIRSWRDLANLRLHPIALLPAMIAGAVLVVLLGFSFGRNGMPSRT